MTPIIVSQNKQEVRFSFSQSQVVAEKFQSNKALFWDTEREQLTTTFSPSYGFKFGDDWQAGLRTEVVAKDYCFDGGGEDRETLLGDSFFILAYELMRASASIRWRPQLFLTLETTVPTGRGIYESRSSSLVDVSGSGRWEQKAGVALFKTRPGYRLNGSYHLLHSFEEKSKTNDDTYRLSPRWSHVIEGGGSTFHPRKKLSFGVNVRFNYKNNFEVNRNGVMLQTPEEYYFDFSPYMSYLFQKYYLVTLTYTDQTLLGPVKNTNLSRSLSLNLMRFFTL